MSLIIKFFCFLLALGLAGLFVLKEPDGSPWLSIDEFIPNTQALIANTLSLANKTKQMVEKKAVNDTNNNNDNIYRWEDDSGQWQYSDTPPTNHTVESIHVSGNLNSDIVEKFTPPPEETLNTSSKAE